MSKEGIVYLLMILNVNRYANVVLERFLRANEGHIGVNERILTIMKQIWTQMNGYFLEMNSKRCIYSRILARVCAVAMVTGLVKNKGQKMVFVYF